MADSKINILFVDDEPMVVNALTRMLRDMRKEWNMLTATGGAEALEKMAELPIDVVVSDIRMPGMSGTELLEKVKERYPWTIRIALSGQSSDEQLLKSVGPVHRYLSKPCTPVQLKGTIQSTLKLRELLQNEELRQIIARIDTLPTLPEMYQELNRAVQNGASLKQVGKIVEKDPGLAATVLRIVNSAYFGLPRKMNNLELAVSFLGMEMLKNLIVSYPFYQLRQKSPSLKFHFTGIWEHGLQVGGFCRSIAEFEGMEKEERDLAFTTGLLHDAGKLLFLSEFTEEYQKLLINASPEEKPIYELENETYKVNHGALAAYLFGMWGLSETLVETVAMHHELPDSENTGNIYLTILDAADKISYILNKVPARDDYIPENPANSKFRSWLEICSKLN
ncbi:MAG: response regulator [Calditrichia bacterium]